MIPAKLETQELRSQNTDVSEAVLSQVSTASAGGCPADLDTISEELFRQLSSGQTVNVSGLLKTAARNNSSSSAAGETLMALQTFLLRCAAGRVVIV